MEKLYLIYVNYVGKDYKGNHIYEFIFSDDIKNIDGDDWDVFPASGRPSPPYDEYIKSVGRLECDILFDVIQNSDIFAVWDAVDDVVALCFENINAYDAYPEKRISFRFGETKENVESKLYEQDLILNYKFKHNE